MYDCIIVGMGPAGLSAAVYAKRSGMNVLLLDETAPGGLLNKISIVENYLGFKSVTGSELAFSMFEHVLNENVEYKMEKVLNIENSNDKKIVTTTKNKYETKTVILAIGRKAKKSGIANEEKFESKGISYCALCDGSLYKNKKLVVLGGGNSAFEESLYLANVASSVTILVRGEITADQTLVDDVKASNIKVMTDTSVVQFLGEESITGVKLSNDSVIDCDGVFVYYGYAADSSFLRNLSVTNESGYIEVSNDMSTSTPGIYACGDIIKKDVYQIITAVSEGAIAAISARKEINKSN
ncbi:MAG: NAD(P)/FAD-dependent oxidoreductase [Tenericutes bacterium]|nr:NAD(P)/FAD-dependent oxidoreductase [Mycoplasmatota bacterium]